MARGSTRGSGEIGRVLQAAASGDPEAARQLLPVVYGDLKALAHVRLRKARRGQTVSTTDLVHEAWLRLLASGDPGWASRRQFFGAAARAMHNILVEQARRKGALKRGEARRVELDAELPAFTPEAAADDALSIGEALEELEEEHPRPAEIVWLRYFGGLSMAEVADVLGISLATAERDWRFARAWLRSQLEEGKG